MPIAAEPLSTGAPRLLLATPQASDDDFRQDLLFLYDARGRRHEAISSTSEPLCRLLGAAAVACPGQMAIAYLAASFSVERAQYAMPA